MDRKQLRIGNYIQRGYFNPHPISPRKEFCDCEVISLGIENLLTTIAANDCKFIKNHYDNIKPIPLTEEWLLKFGFIIRYFREDKNKPLFWKIEGNRHIDIYFEKDVSSYVYMINNLQYSVDIKHVHQLQNLYFALTGQELKEKQL